MISVTVTRGKGQTTLTAEIAKFASKVPAALMAAGQVLLDRSLELVPRDTEALADEGRVRMLGGGSGFATVVLVGYGTKGNVYFRMSPHESAYEGFDRFVFREPYKYAVWVHNNPLGRNFVTGQQDFLKIPHETARPEMRAIFNTIMTS